MNQEFITRRQEFYLLVAQGVIEYEDYHAFKDHTLVLNSSQVLALLRDREYNYFALDPDFAEPSTCRFWYSRGLTTMGAIKDLEEKGAIMADWNTAEGGVIIKDIRPDSVGAEMIAKERQKQVLKHGYIGGWDDQWTEGELIDAAMQYLGADLISCWPSTWDKENYKPCEPDRINDLVVAGALIAAEIDRLKREKQ